MGRRLFNFATAVSLSLCLATAVLWALSYDLAWHAGVKVFRNFRMGVNPMCVVIYNGQAPLDDGIFSMTAAGSPTRDIDYELPGLFLHYYNGQLGSTSGRWWTIDILFFWPLLLTAALPARWVWVRMPRRAEKRGLCHVCRYDLTGNISGVCPECGTPVDVSAGVRR